MNYTLEVIESELYISMSNDAGERIYWYANGLLKFYFST